MRRAERPARQAWSTAPPSTSRTWRRSATAIRCRPASCAPTARRGALLTVLRSGKASTLAVVNNVKAALPKILAGLPPALQVTRALRPVALRARRHQRRGARGRHRGRPHRPDDPAVPGKLAQHGDRLHLDPALDPDFAHRPEPARPDHQRDDAGRPGAGGRHSGGRRHRRNREHPSQHGDEEAAGARRARWRRSRSPRRPSSPRSAICIVFVSGAAAHRRRQVSCSRRWPWPWSSP